MVTARQEATDNITLVTPSGLPAKMVRIMAAVGNVAKAGRNDFQKYNFIQSDDVLDAVRAEMVKQNVVIFPRMIGYEQTAETKGFHAVVQFEFTLIDADSGETLSGTWYGEASDSGDKSFSKAGTSALKYWLLKTFLILAGEPDADNGSPEHDHDERTPRQALKGNGQQQRRIPPQSNQDAPNSSATTKPATTTPNQGGAPQNAQNGLKTPNSLEWLATSVTVHKDRNSKPFLTYHCQEGKATGRGRDLLRKAGYACEEWTVEGITYDVHPPAIVTVQKNGEYFNVVGLSTTAEMEF